MKKKVSFSILGILTVGFSFFVYTNKNMTENVVMPNDLKDSAVIDGVMVKSAVIDSLKLDSLKIDSIK